MLIGTNEIKLVEKFVKRSGFHPYVWRCGELFSQLWWKTSFLVNNIFEGNITYKYLNSYNICVLQSTLRHCQPLTQNAKHYHYTNTTSGTNTLCQFTFCPIKHGKVIQNVFFSILVSNYFGACSLIVFC